MERTPEPPISGELWERLKRFDRRFNISAWREDQWLSVAASTRLELWCGSGNKAGPYRRAWRARIFPKGNTNAFDFIDTAEPLIADALRLAIEQAEARRWHLRK